MSRILIIGSANQDIVARVDHLPQEGETILSIGSEQYFGGKGANQAIACAQLGASCAFIGKVGADSFGKTYLKHLNKCHVNTEGVIISDSVSTGLAIITVDKMANNSIVVMQNANYDISIEEILQQEVLINECEFILLQLELPLHVVEAVIELGFNRGKKIILNPAPGQIIKHDLLKKIYALTPNETEVYQVLGQATEDVQNSVTNRIDNLSLVGKRLVSLGVQNVIITIGKLGVIHVDEDHAYHYKPFNVDAVDTTGAGDTFNGALTFYLSQGYSFSEAITNAQGAAALSTLKLGAQSAMPNGNDVDEFIRSVGVSERILIHEYENEEEKK